VPPEPLTLRLVLFISRSTSATLITGGRVLAEQLRADIACFFNASYDGTTDQPPRFRGDGTATALAPVSVAITAVQDVDSGLTTALPSAEIDVLNVRPLEDTWATACDAGLRGGPAPRPPSGSGSSAAGGGINIALAITIGPPPPPSDSEGSAYACVACYSYTLQRSAQQALAARVLAAVNAQVAPGTSGNIALGEGLSATRVRWGRALGIPAALVASLLSVRIGSPAPFLEAPPARGDALLSLLPSPGADAGDGDGAAAMAAINGATAASAAGVGVGSTIAVLGLAVMALILIARRNRAINRRNVHLSSGQQRRPSGNDFDVFAKSTSATSERRLAAANPLAAASSRSLSSTASKRIASFDAENEVVVPQEPAFTRNFAASGRSLGPGTAVSSAASPSARAAAAAAASQVELGFGLSVTTSPLRGQGAASPRPVLASPFSVSSSSSTDLGREAWDAGRNPLARPVEGLATSRVASAPRTTRL